jgi:uncharacterized membrane protein
VFRAVAPFLAFAVAALALDAEPAGGQESERCYGVALAGRNDGLDGREAPGSATRDFQGNAWVWVPQGSCVTRPLPPQPNGTPRRGALQPLGRDLP